MKTKLLTEKKFHYCPGCGHTIVHKILAEVIEELDIQQDTIAIAPVGCAVLAYDYIDIDWAEAAHGRAPAVALGIKTVHPDKIVISYQGDGDLASIGFNETIHLANRGSNITVIFINNAVYGMTGGQMSPTTLLQMPTTTTPSGRKPQEHGCPLKVCEILNTLDAPYFIARTHVSDFEYYNKTKELIKKALIYQKEGKGYSFIEVLSSCPTNFKLDPKDANEFVKNQMTKFFPIKVFRDKGAE